MTRSLAVHPQAHRRIVHQTPGRAHGPITRLMSPGDLGQALKPFVFLDLFSLQAQGARSSFGLHPHSGIATVTYMICGSVAYQDSTGAAGVLPAGGVEWMQAGNGVWHDATLAGDAAMLGFQLWLALPAALENTPAQSLYLDPADVAKDGPVHVLIGQYGAARSPIPAPEGINYLAVNLRDGERWHYTPPPGHTVAWVAVNAGRLHAGGLVEAGELAAFEESAQGIDFVAQGATSFVLGSAIKHPHDLVTGRYSVHTSRAALNLGEAEIKRIGALLGA